MSKKSACTILSARSTVCNHGQEKFPRFTSVSVRHKPVLRGCAMQFLEIPDVKAWYIMCIMQAGDC